ncbi:hypothetical protein KFL_000750354 [Klebsormidium nitens]|uniref:Uncharacterized protein n=1 Tax=Klebsormidium nitens TaxID=105231 RepID=A0A0U9HJ09_KLENI|nr:hypothetical protein KFL_000750354 [Klebsormidium nitens]|eukprot:GAQ81269.1 hypothetical protein KFL_000750354 [Klebsormidium nitens]
MRRPQRGHARLRVAETRRPFTTFERAGAAWASRTLEGCESGSGGSRFERRNAAGRRESEGALHRHAHDSTRAYAASAPNTRPTWRHFDAACRRFWSSARGGATGGSARGDSPVGDSCAHPFGRLGTRPLPTSEQQTGAGRDPPQGRRPGSSTDIGAHVSRDVSSHLSLTSWWEALRHGVSVEQGPRARREAMLSRDMTRRGSLAWSSSLDRTRGNDFGGCERSPMLQAAAHGAIEPR